jgi:hypothetical protein
LGFPFSKVSLPKVARQVLPMSWVMQKLRLIPFCSITPRRPGKNFVISVFADDNTLSLSKLKCSLARKKNIKSNFVFDTKKNLEKQPESI